MAHLPPPPGDPQSRARARRGAVRGGALPEEPRTLVPPPPRTIPIPVLAVAVGVTVLVGGIALVRAALPEGSQPPAAPPAAQPAPDEEEAPPQDEEERSPEGIRAVLDVSVRSWVQVTVDGDLALEEVLEEGRRVNFRARRDLEVMLGNAGGVRLQVNGDEVPTGAPGEVTTLTFEWDEGRVTRG